MTLTIAIKADDPLQASTIFNDMTIALNNQIRTCDEATLTNAELIRDWSVKPETQSDKEQE